MRETLSRHRTWTAASVLLVALLLSPYVFVANVSRLLIITVLLYALLAVSWNLTLGYAGIFNFAHVAFFGLGAYSMGIATATYDLDPWVGVPIGLLVGAVSGVLTYLPVVRMRGIYVGLITFVFVQLCIYLVLATGEITGGSRGLPGIPSLEMGAASLRDNGGVGYIWLLSVVLVAVLVLSDVLTRSNYGKSLIALRDNETLAVARGIPRIRQHLVAFVISGGIAGLTGALYASYFRVASVDLFSFAYTTLLLSMIFIGGSGRTWGPVLGAVIVTLLDHGLRDAGAWRLVVVGVLTIVLLIALPGGLAGLSDRVRGARGRPHPVGAGVTS